MKYFLSLLSILVIPFISYAAEHSLIVSSGQCPEGCQATALAHFQDGVFVAGVFGLPVPTTNENARLILDCAGRHLLEGSIQQIAGDKPALGDAKKEKPDELNYVQKIIEQQAASFSLSQVDDWLMDNIEDDEEAGARVGALEVYSKSLQDCSNYLGIYGEGMIIAHGETIPFGIIQEKVEIKGFGRIVFPQESDSTYSRIKMGLLLLSGSVADPESTDKLEKFLIKRSTTSSAIAAAKSYLAKIEGGNQFVAYVNTVRTLEDGQKMMPKVESRRVSRTFSLNSLNPFTSSSPAPPGMGGKKEVSSSETEKEEQKGRNSYDGVEYENREGTPEEFVERKLDVKADDQEEQEEKQKTGLLHKFFGASRDSSSKKSDLVSPTTKRKSSMARLTRVLSFRGESPPPTRPEEPELEKKELQKNGDGVDQLDDEFRADSENETEKEKTE